MHSGPKGECQRMFGVKLSSMISALINNWTKTFCYGLGIFLVSIALFSVSPVMAQQSLDRGNSAFKDRNYKLALRYYRKHLRSNPKDYPTWNLLGASYYHVGELKLALLSLKKAEKYRELLSQNYFYQGISFDARGQEGRARKYLILTSRIPDAFGALALLELAGLEYDSRNFKKARQYAEGYLKRFPRGTLRKEAKEFLKLIAKGRYAPVNFTQRAIFKANKYKNHRLSLLPRPHHWIFQTSVEYTAGFRSNPAIENGSPTVQEGAGFEESSLNFIAGFGLGPIQQNDSKIDVGYYYIQNWFTNSQRFEVYLDDPTDFAYFPYRPDLQERHHRFYLSAETAFSRDIDFGLYSYLQFSRAGSDVFPAPERAEIRQSIDIAQDSSVTPWALWRMTKNHSFGLYLSFTKHINLEQEEASYQTFNLVSTQEPQISYGLFYEGRFFKKRLNVYSELYSLKLISNDYWNEYERLGVLAKAQFKLNQNFFVKAGIQMYFDAYTYDQIRVGSCSLDSVAQDSASGITCPRDDQGFKAQAGLTFAPSMQETLSAYIAMTEHTNTQMKVFDEQRFDFYVQYSVAFPSVEQASKYINFVESSWSGKEAY